MKAPTHFTEQVIKIIQSIPKGKVLTYGLVAKLAGNPRGTRGVVWILHSSSKSQQLPWHRVIKTTGELAFPPTSKSFQLQKKLLTQEKIVVRKGCVNVNNYMWDGENDS